jgi:hypothetical protein
MNSEAQIGGFVGKAYRSLRVTFIRILSVAVLPAVCSTAYSFPAKRPAPFNRGRRGANCPGYPAVNPEARTLGRPNQWLSGSLSLIVLEYV